MKITIEFDSIWQNSFLDGNDNKPISKENKRSFKATSKNSDVDYKNISKTTILGVLSRLVGDQRKLYDARNSEDYYFKDIEDLILEPVVTYKHWTENVYIINKSEVRPAKSVYLGTIKEDEKLFFSESSSYLWSILYMDLDEIIEFILSDTMSTKQVSVVPDNLLNRVRSIQDFETLSLIEDEVSIIKDSLQKKEISLQKRIAKYATISKPTKAQTQSIETAKKKFEKELEQSKLDIKNILENHKRQEKNSKIKKVLEKLSKKYLNQTYYDKGKLYPISLYTASLYLQVERMRQENILEVDSYLNNGKIQGFSKRNFNSIRDFLNKLAGNQKKTTGTPYPLTKASGTLEIIIDITRDEAKELKKLIDNAGVSSFYLGKKGLAYVTHISTKEVQK